jgi:hypothetical protein
LVSLLRTSSHAQKQTPTRMAIATTVPAKTISSGTFLPPLLRMCGSEDPGHRLHRCPTTPPEGHCQRTRRLVEPVATGLAHRAQALSVGSTPLRPKDGLDGHKAAWTASSCSDRTPHFCFRAQNRSEADSCRLWCAGSAPTDGVQPPFGRPQRTTRETPEQRPLVLESFGH